MSVAKKIDIDPKYLYTQKSCVCASIAPSKVYIMNAQTPEIQQLAQLFFDLRNELMETSMKQHLQFIRDHELSMPQSVTIMFLKRCGISSVSQISHVLNLSLGGTSHLIDDLVERGYVNRVEDVKDRRIKHISLTAKGAQCFIDMTALQLQTIAQDLTQLPDTLTRNMIDILQVALPYIRKPI